MMSSESFVSMDDLSDFDNEKQVSEVKVIANTLLQTCESKRVKALIIENTDEITVTPVKKHESNQSCLNTPQRRTFSKGPIKAQEPDYSAQSARSTLSVLSLS